MKRSEKATLRLTPAQGAALLGLAGDQEPAKLVGPPSPRTIRALQARGLVTVDLQLTDDGAAAVEKLRDAIRER